MRDGAAASGEIKAADPILVAVVSASEHRCPHTDDIAACVGVQPIQLVSFERVFFPIGQGPCARWALDYFSALATWSFTQKWAVAHMCLGPCFGTRGT